MNRPDFVHEIKGYEFSTDYELLVRLMREQAVICTVRYMTTRDAAQTIWNRFNMHYEQFQISARGIGYIIANDAQSFMALCALNEVKFLVPTLPGRGGM